MNEQSIEIARREQARDARALEQPAWWRERKYGRVRVNEAEMGVIYPILRAAEKAALLDFVLARDAGDPETPNLKRRVRRIELHRRKYLELIEEMKWNLPE